MTTLSPALLHQGRAEGGGGGGAGNGVNQVPSARCVLGFVPQEPPGDRDPFAPLKAEKRRRRERMQLPQAARPTGAPRLVFRPTGVLGPRAPRSVAVGLFR